MNRFLTWKVATVQNFDLRVNVRISQSGNSGIHYRAMSRPDLGLDVVTGYQCDIVAGRSQYNGQLHEEGGRKILAHAGEKVVADPLGGQWVTGTFEVREFESGKWHEYRIFFFVIKLSLLGLMNKKKKYLIMTNNS